MLLPLHLNGLNLDSGTAVAVLSGTVVPTLTETAYATAGNTIVWTLTNDTFVAAGTGPIGSTADTQELIDGLDGGVGWDTARSAISVTDVVRTSDTVATLTLPALALDVTVDETVVSTVPAAVLTGGNALVASPGFSITAVSASKGGRSRRKRRRTRYLVEIDGQFFDAENIAAIRALLDETKQVARKAAQQDVQQSIRIAPPRIKVSLESGAPLQSKAIQREVQQTNNIIQGIYRKAANEISELRKRAERRQQRRKKDDEARILLLL